jgi:hypothetical protein
MQLNRLAPVLGGASSAAAVDDAFAVGFDRESSEMR